MKILLVTNYQPPHMGGIEFAASSLKDCWLRLGHHVIWLTTDIPRRAVPSSADNLRVPATNYLEHNWQINSPLINPFYLPMISRAIQVCDVVNIHSLAPGLASLALLLALLKRKPVVATQHVGVIPLANKFLDAFQNKFLCSMAKWGTGKGMKLTFVGEAVRQWFLDNSRIKPDQIAMTPAGIDQKVFYLVDENERRRLRGKWQIDEERLNLLFVGRLYEKKGLAFIRRLAENCPEIRLTMVGQGPISPEEWGLANIRLIAYVSNEELRELYGAHDLFMMPSVGEGWPAVVPQAMACGLPCLISEETFAGYGKDREQFIVCQRDATMLIKTVMNLSADLQKLSGRREEISIYARKTWNWETTAKIYVSLFEELMARCGQAPVH
jgi:glycosyltransferase involved in cell wall biosynthesis